MKNFLKALSSSIIGMISFVMLLIIATIIIIASAVWGSDKFGVIYDSETKPAPSFQLKLLSGGVSNLNEYKGKPLFIFVWATW